MDCTSSRGEPSGTATTSGAAKAGTDCSTSHEMKCTMEQIASTLTETGAPRSAAKRGTCTGQTTVNQEAPIHFVIPINDMVYRPLLKCF